MYRVDVDEAGDRGMKPASSDHFAVSAIIVADALDAHVRAELANLSQQVGRKPGQVLHFRNLTHAQKVKATQDIAASPGNTAYITHPDPMYLWALRLLLERVSWWIRDHGGGSSIMTFAHIKNFQTHKLHSYSMATCSELLAWPPSSFFNSPTRRLRLCMRRLSPISSATSRTGI